MSPVRGDLLVIVPSRGRPDAVYELARRIADTAQALTALIVAVDLSDPTAQEYPLAAAAAPSLPGLLTLENSRNAAEALNLAARRYAPGVRHLAYLPDVQLPTRPGWDTAIVRALDAGTGLARGYEVSAARMEPARHIAMRAEIVNELGYMIPPEVETACWPDIWTAWAIVTGGLGEAENVIIERSPDYPSSGPRGRHDPCHRPGCLAYNVRIGDDLDKLAALAQSWV